MKKHIKHILIFISAVTAIIIAINKIIELLANMSDHLSSSNGKFYSWKNGDIYFTKSGKGEPVLLIHDLYPASSAYEWSNTIGKLSQTNTVYTIDLLGCGRSDKPKITYTNYLYVQLVNDFIRDIIGRKTNVIATGDSISFVIMACCMEKDNFDNIIAVSPADLYKLSKTPGGKNNALKWLLETPLVGTTIYNTIMSKNQIIDDVCCKFYHRGHMAPTKLIDTYYHAAHMGGNRGKYLLASIKSYYTNINIVHALKNINHNICLIGSKENEDMMDIMEDYTSFNPAIETAYISGTEYLPQLEQPDKFAELISILLQNGSSDHD